MESIKDSISLSYDGNDELKAALGGKEPGKKCRIILDVTTKTNSDEGFEASIDEVELAEDYEPGDEVVDDSVVEDSEEDSDSEDEDPVMVIMKGKKDADE